MSRPRLAIIILSWNSPEDVLECVQSLKNAERDADSHAEHAEILVVDNGSDARTREIVSKIPGTTYLQTGKNLGFGGGNNIGLRWALENQKEKILALRDLAQPDKNQKEKDEIKYILLLNQDTVVDPKCFEILVKAMASDPRIGIAGPLMYDYREREKLIFAGGKLNWLKTKGRHTTVIPSESEGSPCDVDYVTGGALLARRELIETIGLLPEEYFLYFEDVEWNWKAQKAGYRTVVVPNAHIWHKVSTTTKAESPAYIQYHIRNGFRFAWRTSGVLKRLILLLWSVLLFGWQIVQLVGLRKPKWRLAIMKGLTGFWRGQRGEILNF